MVELRGRPLFTQQFDSAKRIQPPSGATYLYGLLEERSEHVNSWMQSATGVHFEEIVEDDIAPFISVGAQRLSLRRRDDLKAYLARLPNDIIYIDMTGLSHHVWAPLVAVALESKKDVRVIYVEPINYRYSDHPLKGEIFDLSERINGIAPLPLFASLRTPKDGDTCLIPLIGFEGARFAFMIEEVDPPGGKIFPVIGVPGFRAEYPFHAYLGNQQKLEETRSWQNVRYAKANCPFQLFYVLDEIATNSGSSFVKIAPVGTKPHALGAVLYCLARGQQVEIVYDNPKRKKSRTGGTHHFLLYSVSDFLRNNPSSSLTLAA